MGKHEATATQVQYPWRSTVRTLVQGFVGLCSMAPLIYAAWTQQDPAAATGAAGGALAVAGGVARVMALPVVDTWLKRYLPWLASEPRDTNPALVG